jgi:MFS family permease
MLVGPLVGGILIVAVGPLNVLLVQAATFAVSGVIVALFVRLGSRDGASAPVEGGGSYRAELLVGLKFVATNSVLLSVAVVVALANGLDAALQTVILPVYAQEIWGSPTSLGALVSASGAGALIGTAVFGAIGHRLPRRLTFLLGGAAAGLLLYGGLALTLPLGLMVVLVVLGGIMGGPIVPLAQTVVQTTTPEELYGRVFGALQSTSMAVVPFGTAIVGFVIEGAGLVPTIVTLGALFLALTLGMLFNPALRQMDADRTVTSP